MRAAFVPGRRACKELCASYVEISRLIGSSPIGSRAPKLACARRVRSFHNYTPLRISAAGGKPASFIEEYKISISFPPATHDITDLEDTPLGDLEGQDVVLHGYLGTPHNLSKKLSFIPLFNRDLSHKVQIVSSASPSEESIQRAHEQIKGIIPNTPVAVTGRLTQRKEATDTNHDGIVKIKSKELRLLSVQPLNEFAKDIIIDSETVFPPEQRHLQLRQEKTLRDSLTFRDNVAFFCRSWLRGLGGFREIETPLLFKSTPEGAREFIVPTRRKGLAYALPQSPQQFKQVLMSGGISRYFQIARCFRDEDLRADRQPEFTQLDLEMAFATSEDVMECTESLIRGLWESQLDIELPSSFTRMTYHDAMSTYGSDKPDARFGMRIQRMDHLIPVDLVSKISPLTLPAVDLMRLPLGEHQIDPQKARTFIGDFLESPDGEQFRTNPDGAPGIFVHDTTKPLSGLQPLGFEAAEIFEELLEPVDGDILILQARQPAFSGGSTSIGNLRLALHKEAVKQGIFQPPNGFEPLWITDFPLFSPPSENEPGQGGSAGLASTHHPFTSPKTPEDVDLLVSDPAAAVGDHYDIVMNGVELGGGSRRIHSEAMQRFVMADVLGMSEERVADFAHLLGALRAGCPPHAGIALGFDRLVAVMLGLSSVRDVIAFPKSGRGEDLMMKSPGRMQEDVLATYHLKLR